VISRGGPQSQIADIARQARGLLGQVRESRWPGFEQPARQSTAKPTAAAVRRPAETLREEPNLWSTLEQIAHVVSTCTKCPLHTTRTQTVPGEGASKARLMFIGEAPGADEDRIGRPFVGAAGQLLDKMIAAMGLARDQVFIANILKCRPPGNRDPLEHEVAACLPYLRAQISLIGPEVICSLGRHASHALLERKDSLGKLRGRFFDYRGTPLLPTFHPSYLLRTPADKGAAWKDLQLIMHRLKPSQPEQYPTEEFGS
jgi:DNA polymerase